MRGPNAQPEFALAVKLTEPRAAEWNTNLAQVLGAWKFGSPAPVSGKGYSGWAIKRSGYPRQLQLVRAGQWTLFTFGSDQLATAQSWLTTAAEGKPPATLKKDVLLTVKGDLPRLGQWITPLKSAQLPPVDLVVTGTGEYLRTEAHWRFTQALPIKIEAWRVPTNMINDPIISFSVGQGIAPVLAQNKEIAGLGWKALPNQFCLWSQSQVPWQTYMSLPVPSATNTINGIAPKFPELVFKALGESLGDITWSSNKAELRWGGLPFIIPFLRPARSGNQDYMYFGLFPPLMRTNPPPPELYAQLSAGTARAGAGGLAAVQRDQTAAGGLAEMGDAAVAGGDCA
jgi:hypothetical protein